MTRILWVWENTPPAQWPTGYEQVLVKAFDGQDTGFGGPFHWAGNFGAWRDKFGAHRVYPWGVAYSRDGHGLGPAIRPAVEGAPLVVLDMEDFNGDSWPADAARSVIEGVRQALPGTQVGYSTYPTRAQCTAHNIDQAAIDALCDVAFPQVYFGTQAAELAQVRADHKHPVVTVSPADYGQWAELAADGEKWDGACAFWRMGVTGWEGWGSAVADSGAVQPNPVPAVDPLRPVSWQGFPAERFIAWDGHRWWVTNCIHSRPATQADAEGLHALGLQVRWWPSCAAETVLAH